MNKYAGQKDDGGFTLIEVLVAAAILSVGLLATLQLIVISASGRRVGKDIVIADSLAKRFVEDAKNAPDSYKHAANIMNNMTAASLAGPVYKYRVPYFTPENKSVLPDLVKHQKVVAAGKEYTLTLSVREDDPATPRGKMVSFKVEVAWSTSGVPHKTTYITYFNK